MRKTSQAGGLNPKLYFYTVFSTSFFISDIYMAPCEFQTLPLRLFNWGLIKTLKTYWWVVLKEPLCIPPTSWHLLCPSDGACDKLKV